jgi:hypothetical protein
MLSLTAKIGVKFALTNAPEILTLIPPVTLTLVATQIKTLTLLSGTFKVVFKALLVVTQLERLFALLTLASALLTRNLLAGLMLPLVSFQVKPPTATDMEHMWLAVVVVDTVVLPPLSELPLPRFYQTKAPAPMPM